MASGNSMGGRQPGGRTPQPVSPEQQAANRQRLAPMINTGDQQRTGPLTNPLMGTARTRASGGTFMSQTPQPTPQPTNFMPQNSFMTALNPQAGGNYNADMQKRLANASAMSQGLPPPYPGY